MDLSTMDYFNLFIGAYLTYFVITGTGQAYDIKGQSEEGMAYLHPRLRIIYGICAVLIFLQTGLRFVPALSSFTTTIGLIGVAAVLILLGVAVFLIKKAERDY